MNELLELQKMPEEKKSGLDVQATKGCVSTGLFVLFLNSEE